MLFSKQSVSNKDNIKKLKKTLAHIYIDFVQMYTYNDFRLYRLLIKSFTFLLLNFKNGSLYMLQTVTVEN